MAGDDEAPWLKEAGPAATQVSRRSLFWTLTLLLSLAAIVAVGLVLLLGRKDGGSTQGYMEAEQAPLIEADIGPYKVAPRDRQGLDVPGTGDVIYEAGEGMDQGSIIDNSALPEEPIGRPRDLLPGAAGPAAPGAGPSVAPNAVPSAVLPAQPGAAVRTAPQTTPVRPTAGVVTTAPALALPPKAVVPVKPPAAPKAVVAVPVKAPVTPAKPADPTAAGSGIVQLGAFSTREKAEAEWVRLAGKAGVSGKTIISVQSGGQTLYRLRSSTADTAATCKKIVAAGGACSAVD
ncbi:SPOR domain-containing protein [Sandarakinorhabdus sp.]|uniref:SPOR domain-containing protein n=1 Tax=Sandarakinorhabdus sp. TaxID=1916663 RepID=UPI00286E53CF|nr:SPOR domain-containing protein [Sandarakinorhabdus sp.]